MADFVTKGKEIFIADQIVCFDCVVLFWSHRTEHKYNFYVSFTRYQAMLKKVDYFHALFSTLGSTSSNTIRQMGLSGLVRPKTTGVNIFLNWSKWPFYLAVNADSSTFIMAMDVQACLTPINVSIIVAISGMSMAIAGWKSNVPSQPSL